jgi:predicted phage terminase large subunit-like protein
VTSGEEADETGIVVAGKGIDADGYILEDLSCRLSPDGWARRAIEAFDRHGADAIIVERNNGGDMCEATLRAVRRSLPIRTVVASRAKHVRFEPVGALYEQGRIHHVGAHALLEDQVCAFTAQGFEGGGSPDRADALVWALSDLLVKNEADWGDLYPRSAA